MNFVPESRIPPFSGAFESGGTRPYDTFFGAHDNLMLADVLQAAAIRWI